MTKATWGTLAEASELLGVSTKTVRRRVSDGSLEARRMGPRLIRVNLRGLENFGETL